MYAYGVRNILSVDSKGIISKNRADLTPSKKESLKITNIHNKEGVIADALIGADAVVGVSSPDIIKPEMIKTMNSKPIIFALANPVPEIMPDIAKKAGAFIVATGRSDFENQVNNALVFPNYSGVLDNNIKKLTDEMQIKVAKKMVGIVKNPNPKKIISSIFDKNVVKAIASSFKK